MEIYHGEHDAVHKPISFRGLTEQEAQERLVRYGSGEITAKKLNVFFEFLVQFKNPLVLILLGAAAVSAFFGDWVSSLLIVVIVLVSAVLDFVNTYRSEHAVQLLRNRVRITAAVVRGGKVREIPLAEVVSDDVVLLSPGDVIPADGVMLEAHDFFVNESSLTGESFPIEKKEGDEVWLGASVVGGSGIMVVRATGMRTRFGGIAAALEKPEAPTEFDLHLKAFSALILRIMFGLVIFVFFVNALLKHAFLDSFLFAVALAVGLTPELLPMILTLNLTKGSLLMARHGVIVKRLSAIQNCGSMDILCTDKTGTLTEDRIELIKYVDAYGKESETVLRYAYLNSIHQTTIKNPLDAAIVGFREMDMNGYRKIEEIPFDFVRRRDSIVVEHHGTHILIVKGAPEEILGISKTYGETGAPFSAPIQAAAYREYERLSADGFRVLGVAIKRIASARRSYSKEEEVDTSFLGFMAFLDPPKRDVAETLQFMKLHGVEIKIVTGDNEIVTQKIAKEIGLGVKGVLLGKDIETMTPEELESVVEGITIFARVNPDQKTRIIEALRAKGHGVGYLGDGVNDAPSLKAADVGISVENAVDAAKASADLILLKKSLHDLTDGVIAGRKTFANTMKYLMMALSSNFGNMFSMAGASLFIPFFPMLPVQILFNNLLYDSSQFALSLDHVEPEAVRMPRKLSVPFLKKFMLVFGPLSSFFDFLTFIALFFVFKLSEGGFQTGWFLESIATQTFVVYVVRTRKIPFWKSKPSAVLILSTLLAVGAAWVVALGALGKLFKFEPLPIPVLIAIGTIILCYLVSTEAVKRYFYKKLGSL